MVHIKPTVRSNIYNLYLIKLSKWFMLIMPVVALFYTDNGLDEFDIYLLQAIYSFSVACLEIPSGYMADVIGRRTSLIIGSLLGTAGFILYGLSDSFSHFLVAEIILGIGGSFISGSDSALLYDSLASQKNEHLYLRYEGRITAMGNFAETIAAICGGFLAFWLSYRSVYVGQAVIASIAIPASLLLVEPQREKLSSRPGLGQILSICNYAIRINKKLGSTILISAVIGTATLCMAWTCQIFFVLNGLTETGITPLWVLLNLTVALISSIAHKSREFLGYRFSLVLIIVYVPLSYILLGLSNLIWGIAILLLFYGVRGYATPVLKDFTNQQCGSEIRATVLSIRSLIIRTSFALLGPAIGYVSRIYSLSTALIFAGCLLLLLSIPAGIYLIRQVPETATEPTADGKYHD